jgi:hypothetical protein
LLRICVWGLFIPVVGDNRAILEGIMEFVKGSIVDKNLIVDESEVEREFNVQVG